MLTVEKECKIEGEINSTLLYNAPFAENTIWCIEGSVARFVKPTHAAALALFFRSLPENESLLGLGFASNSSWQDNGIAAI